MIDRGRGVVPPVAVDVFRDGLFQSLDAFFLILLGFHDSVLEGQILCHAFFVGILGDGDSPVADHHTGVEGIRGQLLDLGEPQIRLFLLLRHKYSGGICYDLGVVIPH